MELAQEHLENFFVLMSSGTLLSLLATRIAGKAGFYRKLSKGPYRYTPSIKDVLTVLMIFFALQLTLMTVILYLWNAVQTGNWHMIPQEIPEKEKIWISSLNIWLSLGGTWLFCFLFRPSVLQSVTETESLEKGHGPFFNFSFGAMSWLICYPIVFTVSQFTGIIVQSIFHAPEKEQTALTLLKASTNQPFQLVFFILSIAIVTPIIEEFLFRGILQRWFISKIGQVNGMILASFCFTALHFTADQGTFNLELLPPLFVLSLYLGYLYERQRSLWAPIGLHSTFNLVSCLLALFSEKL
ncbi:MAG: CPBP family intramembrane metalloprotease [Parachlamydiaceae bacterium]|nr:CPBP family intramembrane metalloprotease [Parachlamydiaceae bacterium]